MTDPIESAITAEHSRQEAEVERQRLEADILDILMARYRVNMHHKGSSEAKVRQYAVWTGDQRLGTSRQVTKPAPHRKAQEHRMALIVQDILDLIEGGDTESDIKHQAIRKEAFEEAALVGHFPKAYGQSDGTYVVCCTCGRDFHCADAITAKKLWANHAAKGGETQ